MSRMTRSWKLAAITVLSFCLLACSAPLVPYYDKAVSESLNASNTDAMTLFASFNGGVQKFDFASRADRYAQLIGKLDALAIAANARPLPKNLVSEKLNAKLDQLLPSSATTEPTIPSVIAIRKLSEAITKMRDTDMKQGLSAYEVIAFKQEVAIYFDQAMTYENFLQR